MQVTFYTFSKKNNSTKQPTGGTDISVRLKENTSILNPVFIMSGTTFTYNYCKWENRYYFINDIVSVTNNMTEYHCSVDVLASYKTQIGSQSQYVLRSASRKDELIPDTLYPAKQGYNISELSLTDIHSNFTTGGVFIVGIVNNSTTSSGAITYYSMTPTTFKSFCNFMFTLTTSGSGTDTWLGIDVDEISLALQKALIDPFQYVKSCMWFPFSIGGTSEVVKFGWWESNIIAEVVSNSNRNVLFSQSATLTAHPQAAARGKYLNGSPYRRIMLQCYNFGMIPIDASYFINNQTIAIGIRTDIFTGIGEVYAADSNGTIFLKQSGQVGVPIQITQISDNLIGSALDLIGGSIGLAFGNVVGYAQGIMSAIETLMPQVKTTGVNGSSMAFVPIPKIVIETLTMANDSNSHNGRPYCNEITINSLSGYVLCQDADIDIDCTDTEKDKIVSYMNGGFFYE